MATGYHAARVANKARDSIVLGDGAVGLSAIIASKLRGVKQLFYESSSRSWKVSTWIGATDNVAERDEMSSNLISITRGGADAVLEWQ